MVRMPPEEVIRFLRSWRERARLTQEDAAARLGVEAPLISKYERGRVPVTLTRLAELADLYGADHPADLMRNPHSAHVQRLLREAHSVMTTAPLELVEAWLKVGRAMGGATPLPAETPPAAPVDSGGPPRKRPRTLHEDASPLTPVE